MTEGRRPRRVAETIRKHLAEALARELFDPRLVGLIVTRVEVGTDLGIAKAYVRLLVGADDATEREVEKALNRAGPILRRGLGTRLGLKKMPELSFFYDSSQKAIDRVEELLGEIQRENSSRSE
jgi:ribosome-binding factor A